MKIKRMNILTKDTENHQQIKVIWMLKKADK